MVASRHSHTRNSQRRGCILPDAQRISPLHSQADSKVLASPWTWQSTTQVPPRKRPHVIDPANEPQTLRVRVQEQNSTFPGLNLYSITVTTHSASSVMLFTREIVRSIQTCIDEYMVDEGTTLTSADVAYLKGATNALRGASSRMGSSRAIDFTWPAAPQNAQVAFEWLRECQTRLVQNGMNFFNRVTYVAYISDLLPISRPKHKPRERPAPCCAEPKPEPRAGARPGNDWQKR
ncbi:hypothetical protein BJ138DRAFT_1106834, partial [Hygrophoropsis aurantiaca]